MTINFNTALGQVRLLASDVNEDDFALTDDMVEGYLVRYGLTSSTTPVGHRAAINRAAADMIDAIATSEALIGKVISTVDGLKTDAAKLADALRKHAAVLRKQADDSNEDDGSMAAFFGGAGGFYTSVDPDRIVDDPDHPEASEYPVGWGY